MRHMTDGIGLARDYYDDLVAPLLRTHYLRLPHAAGRLGGGSDVLGLDDETSRDHDWGLRLTLLVEADAVGGVASLLEQQLPPTYRGLPVRFALARDPMVRVRVEVTTAEEFVASHLGLDASGPMTGPDWLCLTGQALLEVTAGQVFRDDLGVLTGLRQKLVWYPDDVWRQVVAADWIRLGEDLPLLGRAGQRGDDLGSRVIGARLVETALHLAFLLCRHWPPYPKWRGTLFTRLPIAGELLSPLTAVLAAQNWSEQQGAMAQALAVLARAQRAAGLPCVDDAPTEPFFDRPFLGVRATVPDLLLRSVTDPLLRALPPGVGSVEQWVDNVRVLTDSGHRALAVRALLAAGT
jgi:Domain of unknown function (DUF4037)